MQQIELQEKISKQFEKLCSRNIRCESNDCELEHPRCYAGLCIDFLKEQCKNNKETCKFYHFKNKNLQKKGLQKKKINGFCYFNLCKMKPCQNQDKCEYLHPEWNLEYCINCLMDEDCNIQHNDDKTILDWDNLEKQVYQQYNIWYFNPENICANTNCTSACNLNHIPNITQGNYCILYFQGLCPNIKCSKHHKTWEQYKASNNQLELPTAKLYPCIKYSEEKKKELQSLLKQQLDVLVYYKLKQEIKSESTIDIVFIVDCSGTMQYLIDICRDTIQKVVEEFKKQNLYTIRLSFIGYRDYEDDVKIEKLDFTENFNDFTNFLNKIKGYGGEDEAEDVLSGINAAMNLEFADNPNSILITFLFADAPCHGYSYHDENVNDDYPDSVKEGELEVLIQKYQQLKENNFFFCIELNKTTQIMYQKIKDIWPEVFIRNDIKPQEIELFFKKSVALSVKQSSQNQKCFEIREVEIRQLENINYQLNSLDEKKIFWNNFDNNIQNHIISFESKVYIKPVPEKFGSEETGQNSQVFILYDFKNSVKYVMKMQKKIYYQIQNNIQLSKEILNEHKNNINLRFKNQVQAQLLAKIYREKTRNIQGAPPIYFVQPVLITLKKPFNGLTELYAETFINIPDVSWTKYSNDWIYQDLSYYYFSSFSHFTYEESGRQFVLTDLQGKLNILSDPVFHYIEENDMGIVSFKEGQHQVCNFICEQLKLEPFSQQKDNQKYISQWKPRDTQKIEILCEWCNRLFTINMEKYEKVNNKECDNCQDLEQKLTNIQCQCCKDIYNQPLEKNLHRHAMISKCQNCKQICSNQKALNGCYYCETNCLMKIQQIGSNFICQQGLNFLRSLICQQCSQSNNRKEFISKIEYEQGYFICQSCRQQQQ